MKNIKRTLITVVAMILVCVLSVSVTLAYLYDKSESVINTFSVGNVEITLDEADVDDSDGDGSTSDRDTANNYKLISGTTLDKDPTVHVSKYSEESYVFVEVIVDADVAAVLESTGEKSIAAQMTANKWKALEGVNDVYYYESTVTGLGRTENVDLPIFTTISVISGATGEQLAATADDDITITAYAIQADGLDSASAAWAALESSLPKT